MIKVITSCGDPDIFIRYEGNQINVRTSQPLSKDLSAFSTAVVVGKILSYLQFKGLDVSKAVVTDDKGNTVPLKDYIANNSGSGGGGDTTNYLVLPSGAVVDKGTTGTLPADLVVNGGVYTVPVAYVSGKSTLPSDLSFDPKSTIVTTDGTVYYPNTVNNVGVLCSAS